MHALILMLITAKILELHLPQNLDSPKYIALKSIEIRLAKEYAHVGNDFETFSCHIDSKWHGISYDP